MVWADIHAILIAIQRTISVIGILIIVSGVVFAFVQYVNFVLKGQLVSHSSKINTIRLNLGRTLILGLEFIVAADLIGSTTAPDYYAVGLLAIIVLVRTLLTFSINREIATIRKER